MKQIVAIIFLLAFVSLGHAQPLKEVRSEFHQVVMNPDNSKSFHTFMKGVEPTSTTVKAYQAVSEAVLAQVLWNPFSKLSQVLKYDKQIEMLIKEDPENIEIRFLRLAIEFHLPSFLGMSTHIEEDSQIIVQNMSSITELEIEKSYGEYIFYFLMETELVTQEEIDLMEQTLSMN